MKFKLMKIAKKFVVQTTYVDAKGKFEALEKAMGNWMGLDATDLFSNSEQEVVGHLPVVVMNQINDSSFTDYSPTYFCAFKDKIKKKTKKARQ